MDWYWVMYLAICKSRASIHAAINISFGAAKPGSGSRFGWFRCLLSTTSTGSYKYMKGDSFFIADSTSSSLAASVTGVEYLI